MSFIESLTSLFAPNNCLGCGREGYLLCDDCLVGLPPLPGRCFGCYAKVGAVVGCGDCLKRFGLNSMIAVSGYDALAKSVIAQLKFHGNQSAAKIVASLMLSQVKLPPKAVLMHIPATTPHIRQRGYDQAELVARHIARQTGLPRLNGLIRHGHHHQLGASREQRLDQLNRSLRLKNESVIYGQKIILIDDVVTTGSSLSVAAGVLRAAGAIRVDAIVFAQA